MTLKHHIKPWLTPNKIITIFMAAFPANYVLPMAQSITSVITSPKRALYTVKNIADWFEWQHKQELACPTPMVKPTRMFPHYVTLHYTRKTQLHTRIPGSGQFLNTIFTDKNHCPESGGVTMMHAPSWPLPRLKPKKNCIYLRQWPIGLSTKCSHSIYESHLMNNLRTQSLTSSNKNTPHKLVSKNWKDTSYALLEDSFGSHFHSAISYWNGIIPILAMQDQHKCQRQSTSTPKELERQ